MATQQIITPPYSTPVSVDATLNHFRIVINTLYEFIDTLPNNNSTIHPAIPQVIIPEVLEDSFNGLTETSKQIVFADLERLVDNFVKGLN